MFYIVELEDYIRVEPELFGLPTEEAVEKQINKTYENFFDKELGAAVTVLEILNIGEGIIISGDGAAYYNTSFKILVFKPELQEITYAIVKEITNFGAFVNLGAIEGMIHISQTMDDFVNFSKTNALIGKNSKRSLKKGDLCLARIVAISYKGSEPKISVTMRQPGLGKLEWLKDDKRKSKLSADKANKEEEKGQKKKKKK